jgi:hypothetical protein
MPGPVGERSLRRPPFELRPSMQRCARVYGAEARNVLASRAATIHPGGDGPRRASFGSGPGDQ